MNKLTILKINIVYLYIYLRVYINVFNLKWCKKNSLN